MMRLQPPPSVISPTTQVRIYQVFGELKPGVPIEQARAEIEAIHDRYQREHPTGFGTSTPVITPLREKIVGPSRVALGVLLSASILVLLIACANVANLLLVAIVGAAQGDRAAHVGRQRPDARDPAAAGREPWLFHSWRDRRGGLRVVADQHGRDRVRSFGAASQ